MKPLRSRLPMPQIVAALLRKESYSEIAAKMTDVMGVPVSRNVIAGIARDVKNESIKSYVYGVEEPDDDALPVFTGHLEQFGDALVISDIHLPFLDRTWMPRMRALVDYYGLDHIIVAGDLINGDSRHHNKRRVPGPTLHKQFIASRQFLTELSEWVEFLTIIPGNHDEWFVTDSSAEVELTDLAYNLIPHDLTGRVTFSPYDRMRLYSGNAEWVIMHQANAANNPLIVPDKMAQKYQANIVATHQHKTAKGLDTYDRYVLLAIGGIYDKRFFEYTNMKTTTFGEAHQGVATIIDGWGEVYGDDKYTQWEKYGA